MKPKEKSLELVDKYKCLKLTDLGVYLDLEEAKQCALIAINEMIMQNEELYINNLRNNTIKFYKEKNLYLFKVKQEIEKL